MYAVREQGPGVKLQWVVSRGYSVQVARSDIITNFFRMFFGSTTSLTVLVVTIFT